MPVSSVLGLGLEHSCPWPREVLSSKRLSLASDFFLCHWPWSWSRALCPRLHLCKNSGGPDEISAKFVILDADILATPLKILFNYSFEFEIFPDCFKTAKVIPIYKQGDKTEMGNYRPTCILSTFSKILEKLIYNRTQSFLEKHSITLPTHYGFRPAYSTSHAMIDILTSTLDNIYVNKNTALLLLDLKKAFDTLNHDILLNKMNHYGIRGIANNLFASFLANRKQYIFLNHTQSN